MRKDTKLTTAQAAILAKVSRATIQRAITCGELPVGTFELPTGGHWYSITVADLTAWKEWRAKLNRKPGRPPKSRNQKRYGGHTYQELMRLDKATLVAIAESMGIDTAGCRTVAALVEAITV